ncbi:MAG: AAA family ATPase [Succinivibrio sp.]|jgi:hypothetical protein|nr:AAA family ATPase [Succinivibrio sp.]
MKLRYIQPGIASLSYIMARRLAFADKTNYIEILERPDSPDVPVFLRPRRFGKTLFTDILFNYYDKSKAPDFENNFKGTWIYSHPTEYKNSYYCVRLDFSSVTSKVSGIAGGLISELCGAFKDFSDRYPDRGLPASFFEKDPGDDPAKVITRFIANFRSHSKSGEWLYFIIDEYDHFINEVLSKDREAFRDLTSTEEGHSGLVKSFYTCLKRYKGPEKDKPIAKIFMTGVSAISLDSMTSGFNIGTNISADAEFNAMAGFTHDELSQIIDETVDFSLLGGINKAQIMDVMEQRYDGYLFSKQATEKIFCPNMCLTFLHSLIKEREIPRALTDSSSDMDAGKLGGMLNLAEPGVADELTGAIFRREGIASGEPKDLNLNKANNFGREQAVSILTYMGFLTRDPKRTGDASLDVWYRCPNEACYQTFLDCVAENSGFERPYGIKLEKLAENGDIAPLLSEVSRQIKKIPSRGGFSGFNERSLQLIFYFTLENGGAGKLETKLECDDGERGATDIFARSLKNGGRNLLLELKYLPKAKGTDQAVAAKLEEAKAQLERYRKAPNFKDVQNLDCWAIVFVNAEPKAVEKLP